jgi:hypothetical protein
MRRTPPSGRAPWPNTRACTWRGHVLPAAQAAKERCWSRAVRVAKGLTCTVDWKATAPLGRRDSAQENKEHKQRAAASAQHCMARLVKGSHRRPLGRNWWGLCLVWRAWGPLTLRTLAGMAPRAARLGGSTQPTELGPLLGRSGRSTVAAAARARGARRRRRRPQRSCSQYTTFGRGLW